MSTVGVGAAAVGIGGVGVVAAGAVIGAGILVARGIMWCGQKLDENYQNTCKEWTNQVEEARAESRANIQVMSTHFANQLDYATISDYLASDSPVDQAGSVDQQALLDAITRTRIAVTTANLTAKQQAESEQALLSAQLRSEITNGRGILPRAALALAEQGLLGSLDDIRAALNTLQTAWFSVTEAQALRTRTIQQTRQLLAQISARLQAIDTMRRDAGAEHDAEYERQRRQVDDKVFQARDSLSYGDTTSALELATAARQEAEPLLQAASAFAVNSWEHTRVQANRHLGSLQALTTMLDEARATGLIEAQKIDAFAQRLAAAQQEAQILQQATSGDQRSRLARLEQRIAISKDEIFNAIQASQQHKVAEAICSTMAELGYQSETSMPPTAKVSGKMLVVEALSSSQSTDTARDEKVVTMSVGRDGQVAYDFSGYTGKACEKDAQALFSALRDKGIFILDYEAQAALAQIPQQQVTVETLRQPQFQLQVESNKAQGKLAQKLLDVLAKMGYANLRQSAVGGFIELEAFNGPHGYHVVLPPEGGPQIFEGVEHNDISNKIGDPIVDAAQSVHQATEQAQTKKRSRSSMQRRQRKQQMQGH